MHSNKRPSTAKNLKKERMKNAVCVYVEDILILGTEDYREDFHLPMVHWTVTRDGVNFWMSGAVLHVAGCDTS